MTTNPGIARSITRFSGLPDETFNRDPAGQRSAVGRAPDSLVRGPGFDTRSGHILSFFLPLIQEGQLSVTDEVLINRLGGLSLPRKSVVRLTDRPDMTLDVYRGRKTTIQQQQQPGSRLRITSLLVGR